MLWGLDVARFGSDRSALCKRQGNAVTENIRTWKNLDLMQLTGAVVAEYQALAPSAQPKEILVDSIGLGAGVVDRLRELGLAPRVLSGEEEALLSAHGVIGAFPDARGIVADLGGGSLDGLGEADFADIVAEAPGKPLERARLAGAGAPLIDLLVHSGLCPSKGQARKDLEGGGIYVNNFRVAEPTRLVTEADIVFGRHILLRKGKRSYCVLHLEG